MTGKAPAARATPRATPCATVTRPGDGAARKVVLRPSPARHARREPFPGRTLTAALLRERDWVGTPLGPPDRWSSSLLTAVGMCLESTFPMTVLWGPDLIQLYNDAFLPILGHKHPASIARPCEENWPEIWSTVGPLLHRVLAEGQAVWFDDLPLTIRRNGFPEDVYLTFSYTPIREPDGSVGGIFCAVNETTARVRTARRLTLLGDLGTKPGLDVEAAARAAIEKIAEARDDISLAAISLSGPGGSLGPPIIGPETFRARDLGELRRSIDRVQSSGHPEWIELRAPRPIRVNVAPLPGVGGGPADILALGQHPAIEDDESYRAFFRLVGTHLASELAGVRTRETERKRANALAELDRAKTDFFTNVSHEFRTPLTLLDAPLREMGDDPNLPAEDRERVELARRASSRLRRLVNTLLEFSRIQAGTSRPTLQVVDLVGALRDVASVFRSAFERADLSLEVADDGSGPLVLADPEMLERILLNLVSNAFKFTREGGVRLVAGTGRSDATVDVIDTGIGIAAEDLARIFDRFARLDAVWARSREGSGIGLALAAELARIQGGSLSVESAPNVGTSFRLAVPLAAGPVALRGGGASDRIAFADEASGWVHRIGQAQPPIRPASPAGGDRARILVVDDNADMNAYLGRVLGQRWTVDLEADGERALERIVEEPPDLVVADVMMPGLDGLELVRRLRRDARLATLPVVLLSALAGEEARHRGLAAGANEYLLKPFIAADLVVRVASHLERDQAHRAERAALATSQAELRQLVERLRANERDLTSTLEVKDEFVGMVSHEIRTPVTTIRGNAELLLAKADALDPEVLQDAIDDIAVEAERLTSVTENLLVLARVGDDRLATEPVLLARVAGHAASDALREYPGRQVELHVPEGLLTTADESAVEQMLRNLLTNAFKYSEPGTPVTIDGRARDGWLELTVRDRGLELTDADRERIFEPFYRAQRTAAVSGMGIGLTVARRLAELVGGGLRADRCEGGACFTLTLPEWLLEDEP